MTINFSRIGLLINNKKKVQDTLPNPKISTVTKAINNRRKNESTVNTRDTVIQDEDIDMEGCILPDTNNGPVKKKRRSNRKKGKSTTNKDEDVIMEECCPYPVEDEDVVMEECYPYLVEDEDVVMEECYPYLVEDEDVVMEECYPYLVEDEDVVMEEVWSSAGQSMYDDWIDALAVRLEALRIA